MARLSPVARNWGWPVLAGVATFVVQLWICRPLIAEYYPTGDDLALEATSTSIGGPVQPSRWVTDGYHDYFHPYPEWGTINTNFWRPAANALYWLHYELFGKHWGNQLALGYLIHAAVVAIVAYIALFVFSLNAFNALLATLAAACNPALWSPLESRYSISYVLQSPIFQTDIICAFLMLLAFLAFLRERLALFCLLASIAVCLKETALTEPVSAMLITGAWIRAEPRASLKNMTWLGLPLIIWFGSKLIIFRYGFQSYATATTERLGWLIHPFRNALLWPTGLHNVPLRETWQALAARDWQVVLTQGAELFLNAAWWLALFAALIYIWRTWGRRWLSTRPEAWVVGLVFAAGNLGLVMCLQDSQLRFGYLWFALGPAALLAFMARWRAGAALATALVLGFIGLQIATNTSSFSRASIDSYLTVKQSARQLVGLLARLPAGTQTVYLVDDLVVQPASPKYLQQLAGFRGNIILINSLDPNLRCNSEPQIASRYRLVRDGSAITLYYNGFPPCFQWAWVVTPTDLLEHGATIQRGAWLTYQFQDLASQKSSLLGNKERFSIGQNWTVRSTDPVCATAGACVWLGLDMANSRYYEIKPDPPT
jgi:hypothetical protein